MKTVAARTVHIETFHSLRNREPIRVFCDCGIGRDHRTERGVPVVASATGEQRVPRPYTRTDESAPPTT